MANSAQPARVSMPSRWTPFSTPARSNRLFPVSAATTRSRTVAWTCSSRIFSGGCITVASKNSSTPSRSVMRPMVTVRGASGSEEPAGSPFPAVPVSRLGTTWSWPSLVRSAER